jgi:hypothetical protein
MTGIRVWISRTNSFGSPVMIVQACSHSFVHGILSSFPSTSKDERPPASSMGITAVLKKSSEQQRTKIPAYHRPSAASRVHLPKEGDEISVLQLPVQTAEKPRSFVSPAHDAKNPAVSMWALRVCFKFMHLAFALRKRRLDFYDEMRECHQLSLPPMPRSTRSFEDGSHLRRSQT